MFDEDFPDYLVSKSQQRTAKLGEIPKVKLTNPASRSRTITLWQLSQLPFVPDSVSAAVQDDEYGG